MAQNYFDFMERIYKNPELINRLGFVVATAGALLYSFVIASKGMAPGIILIAGLIGIPAFLLLIFRPFIGVVIMISISFFVLGVKRFQPAIPLGIVTDMMIAGLVFSVIYNNIRTRDWSSLKGMVPAVILIYMIYSFASILNPSVTCNLCYIYTIRSMAGYMIVFYIFCYAVQSKKHIVIIIKVWIFLAVLAAVYALKQEYIGFAPFESHWIRADPDRFHLYYQWGHMRIFSFFSDPTAFGIAMGYTLILCVVFLFSNISKYKKLILGILILLITQAMILSGTRTAYLIVPVGAMLFLVLIRNRKIYITCAIAAALIAIVLNAPIHNTHIKRVKSAFTPSDDPSYQVRLENQRFIRPIIQQSAFGSGLGTTGVWGKRFDPDSFLAGFPTDSIYVRIALELGWVGLTIFMIMWVIILKTAVDNYFRIRDPDLKYAVLAMSCVVFSLFVVSYVQQVINQIPTSMLFWAAVAIIHNSRTIDEKIFNVKQVLR